MLTEKERAEEHRGSVLYLRNIAKLSGMLEVTHAEFFQAVLRKDCLSCIKMAP